jgi:GT2 family glycosyltransferase
VIYFITVNYYSTELVQQLLKSIAATVEEYQLLIVNNSPEDDSINEIAQTSVAVTVINAKRNLGFGVACNLGIEHVYRLNSQGIIWLINPDAIIEKKAVSYLRGCLKQEPSIAILGTRVRDLEGKIWFGLGTFNPWTGSLKHQLKREEGYDPQVNTINCRWVSGCSLILNLKQFDRCPSFDPHYFLYYEDADLCERYYKKGYRIAVTQAVLVTHAVSAISQRNLYTQFKHATYSKLYFLKQHGTALALWLNLVYMLMLVVLLFPKNRPVAIGRWQGLKNFIYGQIGKATRLSCTP